jgi:SAM-dependent methyltransferase
MSITYNHIFATLATEIGKDLSKDKIDIIDMGCGNGKLISFLQENLSKKFPNISFHIQGFDVSDSSVQSISFFTETISYLNSRFPNIKWGDRLIQITSNDKLPYDNNSIDYVISNQVMEHVFDPKHTIEEVSRILRYGGKSIHLFPLRRYWFEGHLFLFFVHRIYNYDYLFLYIKLLSLLRLGKFGAHKLAYNSSISDFSEAHSDYMIFNTHYLTKSRLLEICKKASLRSSFRYTEHFYWNKLRQLFGLKLWERYSDFTIINFTLFPFFCRISCSTLFLEKKNSYPTYINEK